MHSFFPSMHSPSNEKRKDLLVHSTNLSHSFLPILLSPEQKISLLAKIGDYHGFRDAETPSTHPLSHLCGLVASLNLVNCLKM